MAVGPLLMACKSLASSPKMTAVSLHVTSLLWQRHDECFPYLIQMVSSSGRLSGVDKDECLLARATCLQDVCYLRSVKLPGQWPVNVFVRLVTALAVQVTVVFVL
jgi:hypothetical protein